MPVRFSRLLSLTTIPLCIGFVHADTVVEVGTVAELRSAIAAASTYTGSEYIITLTNDIRPVLSKDSQQFFVGVSEGASLVIDGNGYTLDMSSSAPGALTHPDRAFYVAYGNVTFSNLTIANGNAQGGNGGNGGGGGMGAGGAIYVANGNAILGNGIATSVWVDNVTFSNNTALGGSGGYSSGPYVDSHPASGGGGGGMGGNGGNGFFMHGGFLGENHDGNGGGGGFGKGADGGMALFDSAPAGADGAYTGGASGGSGSGNNISGGGGANGGGGGAAESSTYIGTSQVAGGGGGVGGSDGVRASTSAGGAGGYGGGGGGGRNQGGAGGFGGGGGAGFEAGDDSDLEAFGGAGGFGGGGGTGRYRVESSAGAGGFGGGDAVNTSEDNHTGGGGMGAGGAIFSEAGTSLVLSNVSFTGNTATGGTSRYDLSNGIALGDNAFLGSDVTFDVRAPRDIQYMSGLGGGGDTTDSRVAGRDTGGNAQGGLIKTGLGTLVLEGDNNYAGATDVRHGKLSVQVQSSFTAGYVVRTGAQMEIATADKFTPAEITLEEGATVSIAEGTSADLANTVFSRGVVQVDGSVSNLQVAEDNTVVISGSGYIDAFDGVARFSPTGLEIGFMEWRKESSVEVVVGESMLGVGRSRFSNVGSYDIAVIVSDVAAEVEVGDIIRLIHFADMSLFSLGHFRLVSELEGFEGRLTVTPGDGADDIYLAVRVDAIPEPATYAALAGAALLVLVTSRRLRRKN